MRQLSYGKYALVGTNKQEIRGDGCRQAALDRRWRTARTTTVPDKGTAANYLEGENDWTTGAADTFAQQPATSNFNDYLLFQ